VGICRGQQKRHMHLDLARNIFAINEVVKPDLIVVDGLVGMEGNGPGDGEPFRLGHLFVCNDAFVNDVAVMRLVDFPMDRAPYMRHAQDAGYFDERLIQRIHADLAPLRPIELAPKRSKLAELSEKRSLMWLKLAVRPLVQQPMVAEAAYRAGIIQDVYSLTDDTAALVARTDDCDECGHCEQVCPTHLSWSEIGVKTDQADCMQCLYCWWVCPQGALELSGDLNHLERQVARYKTAVEALACSG
jgi:ferredoxin